MKKLLKKTILYILILLLIPYLYFIWQAKQGVDAFIITHPTGGEFQYQWIWIDLNSHIVLSDVSFHQDSKDPIFTAQKIEIIPTSIFDLIGAEEHIIYKEYPPEIKINLVGGVSGKADELFALFNVNYKPELLGYLYPQECLTEINKQLPYLSFDLTSQFIIQRTADESSIDFSFSSREFANIKGEFKINNFSEDSTDGSYISGLSISFTDLTWIQQNTQKCLSIINLDKESFSENFSAQLVKTAKDNRLLIDTNTTLLYANFIYLPQKIHLNFNLEDGKTFSQISSAPLYQFQKELGLTIDLNEKNIGNLFQLDETVYEIDVKSTAENPNKEIHVKKKNTYLRVNRSNLRKHLGSKIQINLYNGKEIIGYIEKVNSQSIKIRQLKFKGESILPFAYRDIKSILLLLDAN